MLDGQPQNGRQVAAPEDAACAEGRWLAQRLQIREPGSSRGLGRGQQGGRIRGRKVRPLCARHRAKGFRHTTCSNLPRGPGTHKSHVTGVKTDRQRRGAG